MSLSNFIILNGLKEVDIYIKSIKDTCPLVAESALKYLRTSLIVKNYEKGDIVFNVREEHSALMFIVSGFAKACYLSEDGSEKIAWFIEEEDFITDFPTFLNDKRSNYFFQCIEDTTVVILKKSIIYKAYQDHPSLETYGRIMAEEVINKMQSRIESLLFLTAKERYLDFLTSNDKLLNRITVGQLASYLGVERQTLTRIRRNILHSK